jgi:hypothetical protein
MSRKPSKSRPSDLSSNGGDVPEDPALGSGAGTVLTETEPIPDAPESPADEPAQVQLTIKGSDKSARAAAKRFGGDTTKPAPVATPASDVEPPDDTDALLADGRNMVVVQRQFPKSVEMADGTRRRCAIKLPDRYQCPTTREEIENDVFDRHGGKKYKCTIHPATTNGEEKMLGFFTIEHPEVDAEPFFEDAPTAAQQQAAQQDPRTMIPTSASDPTMRETDPLIKLRQDLERRLERARVKKEIEELESQVRDMEGGNKPPAPALPVGESDEVKKLREQNAQLAAQLAEKKVNDRFDKLETSITSLAQSIAALATAKPASSGESDVMKFLTKKMDSDATQISTLMTALTTKAAAPVRSSGDELDTFLNRAEKLKAITGAGEGKGTRLSELEGRLIDMSFDNLMAGGGGKEGGESGSEYEDVAKLAVKEFAPILKSLVETQMKKEPGGVVSKEREQQIHAEAAQAVAKKVHDDLMAQGIQLTPDASGRLIAMQVPKGKIAVPPRHAGTKVVSEQRSSGGTVKQIAIQPTDLTKKTQPVAPAEAAPGEGGDVKHGVFPMLGEGGATLKIPFPVHPGEMKYDRKFAVDFVLHGIRSEIRQGFPQQAAENKHVESYVAADAIEFLDDELLDRLEAIDSGPQLEALLMESGGDRAQVDEIKKAGEDEAVASFLRRLIKTVQAEWIKEKAKGGK